MSRRRAARILQLDLNKLAMKSLEAFHGGCPHLSPLSWRQNECVILAGCGLRDKESAHILGVTHRTFQAHLRLAQEALGFDAGYSQRVRFTLFCVAAGLIKVPLISWTTVLQSARLGGRQP